jgi:pimeloyl-ACP methyl ester carboxylesterase
LIDHLGSYIFNGPDGPSIDQHLVLGVSLGGHAAWQVLFNEPRVAAAVVIIGCPDYMRKFFLLYCITNCIFSLLLVKNPQYVKVCQYITTSYQVCFGITILSRAS